MAEAKKGAGLLGLLIFVGLVGSCAMMLRPEPKTPEQEAAAAEHDKFMSAMFRCKNEVKSRLADTDGFDAQPYGEWLAQPANGGNEYTFSFRIKAKNAFAALVWADITCRVEFDGKWWSVTDLKQS